MTQIAAPETVTNVFRWGTGIELIERADDGLIQLGAFPPRRLILQANSELARCLRLLAADEVARGSGESSALPTAQQPPDANLLEELNALAAAGFLRREPFYSAPQGLCAEEADITQRHGAHHVARVLQRRADAVVEIRGSGPVASTLATTLAAAGVGHIVPVATRAMRDGDLLPPGAPGEFDFSRSMHHRLTAVSGSISTHGFAGHLSPTLVVLAGDGPANAAEAAVLHLRTQPYLAAWARPARTVIGPLVLPGLSSCLWCAELTRSDADPGWPAVRSALEDSVIGPTAAAGALAAALAATEVLDFVDEIECPATVNGTLESAAGGRTRRRTWAPHPDCRCTSARMGGRPSPSAHRSAGPAGGDGPNLNFSPAPTELTDTMAV